MATTNYSFAVPTVGGSVNVWGADLNANWEKVDGLLSGTYLDGGIPVNLDGIYVINGTVNSTVIGNVTPAAATFTIINCDDVIASGDVTVGDQCTATQFNGPVVGSVTGNADSATALATARRFSIEGPIRTDPAVVTSFDGTGDVALAVTIDYDLLWPIGVIYTTVASANPATLFTGTVWEAIGAGQVLLGVGTHSDVNAEAKTFVAGDTGGAYNHTLSISEIPPHSHTYNDQQGPPPNPLNRDITSSSSTQRFNTPQTSETGGGLKHNNMQPYLTVYMWKRIS